MKMTSCKRRSPTMKQNRDKLRAKSKGKKKTKSNEKNHQNLPLQNKLIYIDVKQGKQCELIEDQLKKLGARVEKFLSCEVNYVITVSDPSKAKDKIKDENPHSPSFNSVTSPFNSGPSPSAANESKRTLVSRGKALAQIACAKNQASSVVANAEKLGIKIIPLDVASKWLEKELKKLDMEIKNDTKKTDDINLCKSQTFQSKKKKKLLKGSFIKFEAVNKLYRPVKFEFPRWPKINLHAPAGISPFGEAKLKVQHQFKTRKLLPVSSHPHDSEALSGNNNDQKEFKTDKRMSTDIKMSMAPVAPEMVGVPIGAVGELKGNFAVHFKKSTQINKQQGYCDCCEMKYNNLSQHLVSDEHREFTRDKSNYETLDALIRHVPSTANFLQTVLLHQCTKRKENTEIRKSDVTNCLLETLPKSPLSAETNSSETVGKKTPEVVKITCSTRKIVSNDFLSVGHLSMENHNSFVVQQPTSSCQIRSSPRCQPTPTKKPWVQERSMVFRDSPMASLQPTIKSSPSFNVAEISCLQAPKSFSAPPLGKKTEAKNTVRRFGHVNLSSFLNQSLIPMSARRKLMKDNSFVIASNQQMLEQTKNTSLPEDARNEETFDVTIGDNVIRNFSSLSLSKDGSKNSANPSGSNDQIQVFKDPTYCFTTSHVEERDRMNANITVEPMSNSHYNFCPNKDHIHPEMNELLLDENKKKAFELNQKHASETENIKHCQLKKEKPLNDRDQFRHIRLLSDNIQLQNLAPCTMEEKNNSCLLLSDHIQCENDVLQASEDNDKQIINFEDNKENSSTEIYSGMYQSDSDEIKLLENMFQENDPVTKSAEENQPKTDAGYQNYLCQIQKVESFENSLSHCINSFPVIKINSNKTCLDNDKSFSDNNQTFNESILSNNNMIELKVEQSESPQKEITSSNETHLHIINNLDGSYTVTSVPNIADRVKTRLRLGHVNECSELQVDNIPNKKREKKKLKKNRLKDTKVLNSNTKTSQDESSISTVPIIPNIAERVKKRRSCTLFNHDGQYSEYGVVLSPEQQMQYSKYNKINRSKAISSEKKMPRRKLEFPDQKNSFNWNKSIQSSPAQNINICSEYSPAVVIRRHNPPNGRLHTKRDWSKNEYEKEQIQSSELDSIFFKDGCDNKTMLSSQLNSLSMDDTKERPESKLSNNKTQKKKDLSKISNSPRLVLRIKKESEFKYSSTLEEIDCSNSNHSQFTEEEFIEMQRPKTSLLLNKTCCLDNTRTSPDLIKYIPEPLTNVVIYKPRDVCNDSNSMPSKLQLRRKKLNFDKLDTISDDTISDAKTEIIDLSLYNIEEVEQDRPRSPLFSSPSHKKNSHLLPVKNKKDDLHTVSASPVFFKNNTDHRISINFKKENSNLNNNFNKRGDTLEENISESQEFSSDATYIYDADVFVSNHHFNANVGAQCLDSYDLPQVQDDFESLLRFIPKLSSPDCSELSSWGDNCNSFISNSLLPSNPSNSLINNMKESKVVISPLKLNSNYCDFSSKDVNCENFQLAVKSKKRKRLSDSFCVDGTDVNDSKRKKVKADEQL